ncbi:hypothetical protein [Gluconacetobacter entanii]|uniref:hypothetical protein n=1 Tax=Gluconacetobacter entanii TaxID=108528 RepID=UPI0021BBEF70|nr:hypothetical protein [Gluconacetobacter entanii]MCW4580160.1 hypothetical protein [Gluconacetobacter entanii]MCW4584690.1 hypothetical protein [Gluconacetobacter entanii]MCW4588048.1 hypothetical protein [Gluconacetobacter entanii]
MIRYFWNAGVKKLLLITLASTALTAHAYADDIKLPDGTPASVDSQTPCKTDGYKDYPICINAMLQTPSDAGGTIDIRAIEALLPKGAEKAVIISEILATRVMPMNVSLSHFDDKDITWPASEFPLDHITIPNNGTYQVVLSTNNGGKSWGLRIVIEQAGYTE